jgi:hypothetical protein
VTAKKAPKRRREPAIAPEPPEPQYILGTWAGRPRYQCRYCPFDTLDKQAALEHFKEEHAAKITQS